MYKGFSGTFSLLEAKENQDNLTPASNNVQFYSFTFINMDIYLHPRVSVCITRKKNHKL